MRWLPAQASGIGLAALAEMGAAVASAARTTTRIEAATEVIRQKGGKAEVYARRRFPKCHFYIPEREIAKWVWAMSLPERMRFLLTGIDPGDILNGVELARQRRLVCVDGDMDNVLPGINLHSAPDTHTYGSMWFSVRNDGKDKSQDAWVLAGDLIYKFENLGDVSGKGGEPDGRYLPVGLLSAAKPILST